MFGPLQKNLKPKKCTTDSEIGNEEKIELSEPTQKQSGKFKASQSECY